MPGTVAREGINPLTKEKTVHYRGGATVTTPLKGAGKNVKLSNKAEKRDKRTPPEAKAQRASARGRS
jgi:hypothetical protein